MTAREMFEKLGYKCYEYDYKIKYYMGGTTIEFFLGGKLCNIEDMFLTKKINKHIYSKKFFNAINQQIKELGWDD